MKKLFFIFIVFLFAFLCTSLCFADNISWSVDRGVLSISGTGDMPSYTQYAAPWCSPFYQYDTVVIGEGITGIGDYAFHLRSSVYRVSLPTTLRRIGSYAFAGTNIQEVSFPYGLASVGAYAYSGCASLTLVSIPYTLTDISDSAFLSCNSLAAIYVDLSNPVYAGLEGVLYSKDMTKLLAYPAARQFPDFTIPASVVSLAPYTFANSKTLQSVTLHDGITQIPAGCFAWCSSLQSVVFPAHLTTIGDYAFYYCTSIQTLTLPQTLSHIGNYAFGGCDAVTQILFSGSSAQWNNIQIGHNYILTVIPVQHDYQEPSGTDYAITVLLNGEKMHFDTDPILQNGRTLVPMRAIFEALGASVTWEPTTKTIIASCDGNKITIQIDNPVLKINDVILALDVPAQIVDDRTLVPLRAVSECLSCVVTWEEENKTVSIHK